MPDYLLSGRSQGHLAHFYILGPRPYLWSGWNQTFEIWFANWMQRVLALHMLKFCSMGGAFRVRNLLKFWEISANISETVPDRHIVTHTPHLMAIFPGLPRWAGTRKVKPIRILLKQETVSGSGISWVICKSAPCSRQTTTPAPHHSVFYRQDALPAAQPTASKHWRPIVTVED